MDCAATEALVGEGHRLCAVMQSGDKAGPVELEQLALVGQGWESCCSYCWDALLPEKRIINFVLNVERALSSC